MAVAPGLLLHARTNWDLVAAALAGLGLLAWARRRPVLAGVLLGLATATKLYPVLFLVPLLALCWRAGPAARGALAAGGPGLGRRGSRCPSTWPARVRRGRRRAGRVAAARWTGSATRGWPRWRRTSAVWRTAAPSRASTSVYRFVELNAPGRPTGTRWPTPLQQPRVGLRAGRVGATTGSWGWSSAAPGSAVRLNLSVAVGTLVVSAWSWCSRCAPRAGPGCRSCCSCSSSASCSPTRSGARSTSCGCCRSRRSPGRAGGRSWSGRPRRRGAVRPFYYFVSLPLGGGDQTSEGIDVGWFLTAVRGARRGPARGWRRPSCATSCGRTATSSGRDGVGRPGRRRARRGRGPPGAAHAPVPVA